jgi:hypothetical protein
MLPVFVTLKLTLTVPSGVVLVGVTERSEYLNVV